MNGYTEPSERGLRWVRALAQTQGVSARGLASVVWADAIIHGGPARFITVGPYIDGRFPRARNGEVGLEEGWALADLVARTVELDRKARSPRPIIAIVDVASQAYGRREEMLGLHLACAAAAAAYAQARLAGHPIVALIVGKAMSGAFLAHGYKANRLLALDADGVLIHAMGKEAAARVTRRTVQELDALGAKVPPMGYDIQSYAKLGLLHALIEGVDADDPSPEDVLRVGVAIGQAVGDIREEGSRYLTTRLTSAAAHAGRPASIEVRRRLAEHWDA